MVAVTFDAMSAAGVAVRGSASRTTMSASIPGESFPRRCSPKVA
jgi:hypothetical protein